MTDGGMRVALRHRNFRMFFLGEVVNTAGSSMASIALAFAVLQIDDSATTLGWVVASAAVPMVAFMLGGGAVADRLPRALVLRGCNLLQGLAQALTAMLVLTGTAQIWHLIVLQFLCGCALALSYPAFHGMVPVLVPEEDRKSAYLLLGQARSALQVLGPAAAGVIVAVGSPGIAMAVDAATYFVAAIFLSLVRVPPREDAEAPAGVLADFRAGWSYARSLGWVIPIALCSLVYNAVATGALSVLGPVMAEDSIGSSGWGFARAAQAVGVFGFAFVLARITIRRPLLACQVGFLTLALPMLCLGLGPQTVLLAAAFFVAGCGFALIDLSWAMTVQEKVSEAMLSRIHSIDGFFSFVAVPIGQVAAGPAAVLLGMRGAQFTSAGLCLVVFVLACALRPLRTLRLEGPSRASLT